VSALLEVRAVSHAYRQGGLGGWAHEQVAVRCVDLDVNSSETVGLLGQSGSGKTTLVRICLRLLRPSGGSVLFRGADIYKMNRTQVKSWRHAVQAVFQDPFDAFDPRRTVADFLEEPMRSLATHGSEERGRRVQKVLHSVHLHDEVCARYPHQLSGGQRQRLALARALTVEPELLILDEPVSALDVAIQAQIVNLLRDIQLETGVAMLVVAHDLAMTRQLADRIAVMRRGRIIECGLADEVYSSPGHWYTQALLRASAAAWEPNGGWSSHNPATAIPAVDIDTASSSEEEFIVHVSDSHWYLSSIPA